MKINLHSAVIALSLASWIQQAAAQVQSPARPESGSRLPTVTVTSERAGSFKSDSVQVGTFRDMAPLDVPQTSNVVTREVLDAQATTSLFGALRNTAGVTRSQLSGSTYDNISIAAFWWRIAAITG